MNFVYLLLEKIGYTHPMHPAATHMPIGLVVGALVLSLAGWWLNRPNWMAASNYCMVLALFFLVLTALTGYWDWQRYYNGAWLAPIIIKFILTGVFLLLLAIPLMLKLGVKSSICLYSLCFLTLVGLGFYGGELSLGGTCVPSSEQDTKGARLYHVNCGACHPSGGNIMNSRLPLIGAPQLANFEVFLAFNRNPARPDGSKAIMPAYTQEDLSDQEMQELYDYIMNVMKRLR